jgi:single-strand DNA-binding protein
VTSHEATNRDSEFLLTKLDVMQGMKNSVTLMGNLGAEVQVTTLSTGRKVARASLATHAYRYKKNGERIQETQWHNIVGWGRQAEHMAQKMTCGELVLVHGKLIQRSYQDKSGQTRYITEVIVGSFAIPHRKAS